MQYRASVPEFLFRALRAGKGERSRGLLSSRSMSRYIEGPVKGNGKAGILIKQPLGDTGGYYGRA